MARYDKKHNKIKEYPKPVEDQSQDAEGWIIDNTVVYGYAGWGGTTDISQLQFVENLTPAGAVVVMDIT